MTLKRTITEQLLNCVDDPGGLEEVFRRHSRSKGPLYSALAEATGQLQRRLEALRFEASEAGAVLNKRQGEVRALGDSPCVPFSLSGG